MHLAKRNSCALTVYAGEDDPDGLRHLLLRGDLQSAIQQNEMSLRYQPKVRMEAATFSGVEVLLRWKHPWHGMISPDVFIRLAEQTGMIEPLTRWVLDQALKQQAEWRAEGFDVSVSVNLSPRTLHDITVPKQVAATLERWRTSLGRLSLEITESAIMSDVVRANETAQRLSAMGVRISIDDFSTGYTSFAYIRKLPISEIKVDKSFFINMKDVSDNEVIVRSIVTLRRNLGVDVVAEGVVDEAAWTLLPGLNCTEAQGYFISRPISANALGRWMREPRWAAHNGTVSG
jgi:EAL domain-containing protein (putative c-di-GMP-specific phosphodiesterase class I)